MSGDGTALDLFGALVLWGTPLAIVLWLVLRHRQRAGGAGGP